MSNEDASAEIEPTRPALPDSLDGLAEVATAEHEAFERDARSAIGHAIRAGEALVAAKSKVRHGDWLPWLEARFPASEDTAQNYMRLARNAERVRNLPSIRAGITELAEPRDDAEEAEAPPPEVEPSALPAAEVPLPGTERPFREVLEDANRAPRRRVRKPPTEEEIADGIAERFGNYLLNASHALDFARDDLHDDEVDVIATAATFLRAVDGRADLGTIWSIATHCRSASTEIVDAVEEYWGRTESQGP
jgi:hypothetical protein